MATVLEVEVDEVRLVEQIGDTAGVVWHCLADNGKMSLAKLVRSVDAPRDTVVLAVGWLAREDKVTLEETARGRLIGLK